MGAKNLCPTVRLSELEVQMLDAQRAVLGETRGEWLYQLVRADVLRSRGPAALLAKASGGGPARKLRASLRCSSEFHELAVARAESIGADFSEYVRSLLWRAHPAVAVR